MNLKSGDKVVCIVEPKVQHDYTPKKGDKLTIKKIRLYEKLGWMISFEEYDENIFYNPSGFTLIDYDFVENIIKNL